MSKSFNFGRSVAVSTVSIHHTHNVFDTPRDFLEIHSPATLSPYQTDTEEITFVVSKKMARHTGFPCYDHASRTLAFASKFGMMWYLDYWGIQPMPVNAKAA